MPDGAEIEAGVAVGSAAVLGADFPGMRPAMAVEKGDTVAAGQTLFRDRADRAIAFAAPIAGVVERIDLGPRRTLGAVVIRAVRDAPEPISAPAPAGSAADLRATLLSRGLWSAFLTRPYGRIPSSLDTPAAIFVTATPRDGWSPDPRVVLAADMDLLRRGLELLSLLTEGTVHLCQTPGADIGAGTGPRIVSAYFPEGPGSGLAGTHVHRLHPVAGDGAVWTIGYQDVVAMARLVETGIYPAERVIAVAGPRAARPLLMRAVLGADVEDLVEGRVADSAGRRPVQALSGDAPLAGWLGRHDLRVVLGDAPPVVRRRARPGAIARLLGGAAGGDAVPRPLIPTAALDRAVPFDLATVPLMRALATGDAEAAMRLGCLELVEEDVAALSRLCTSGADYGVLLRRVLDELRETA